MVNIILYGDLNDKKISKLLINSLEGKYNITHKTPDKINSYLVKNSTNEILIIETNNIKFVESSNTIVIFKNTINNEIDLEIRNKVRIIVYSQNFKAIAYLSNAKLQNIITFGYKSTDTLTASSLKDQEKMISLQRQIKAINGKTIEPFEFSIKEKVELLTVLPVYGVLLLLDKL